MRFDDIIPHGGYAWWYVDALSDEGDCGLTVIAFLGSVFSPYYALARRRLEAGPLNHCAVNVVLHQGHRRRWAMTERGVGQVSRASDWLVIGPSSIRWDGAALEIKVDERCAPVPRRLRGKVRLYPSACPQQSFPLDSLQRHVWTPLAPCARVEAAFTEPALNWSGGGYFDSNRGSEPLEAAFRDWTWSRIAATPHARVLYDVNRRDGSATSLALEFTPKGEVHPIEPPRLRQLAASKWGIARRTRADEATEARIVRTLVDAPFYCRTLLETRRKAVTARAVHESLDLDRFSSLWVKCLLPFRMPRLAR